MLGKPKRNSSNLKVNKPSIAVNTFVKEVLAHIALLTLAYPAASRALSWTKTTKCHLIKSTLSKLKNTLSWMKTWAELDIWAQSQLWILTEARWVVRDSTTLTRLLIKTFSSRLRLTARILITQATLLLRNVQTPLSVSTLKRTKSNSSLTGKLKVATQPQTN